MARPKLSNVYGDKGSIKVAHDGGLTCDHNSNRWRPKRFMVVRDPIAIPSTI